MATGVKLGNLGCGCRDAEAMQKSFQSQRTLFKETDILLLLDGKATLAEILASLDRLAEKVGPEDRCLIYLTGRFVYSFAYRLTGDATLSEECVQDVFVALWQSARNFSFTSAFIGQV